MNHVHISTNTKWKQMHMHTQVYVNTINEKHAHTHTPTHLDICSHTLSHLLWLGRDVSRQFFSGLYLFLTGLVFWFGSRFMLWDRTSWQRASNAWWQMIDSMTLPSSMPARADPLLWVPRRTWCFIDRTVMAPLLWNGVLVGLFRWWLCLLPHLGKEG